ALPLALLLIHHRPRSTLFPYTTLFRSLFAARIQEAERIVPSATMHVAKKCSLGPTRPVPKSMMPRKPASRKNDVSTSRPISGPRSEEHTSELQSRENLVCRLLLEKKKR